MIIYGSMCGVSACVNGFHVCVYIHPLRAHPFTTRRPLRPMDAPRCFASAVFFPPLLAAGWGTTEAEADARKRKRKRKRKGKRKRKRRTKERGA